MTQLLRLSDGPVWGDAVAAADGCVFHSSTYLSAISSAFEVPVYLYLERVKGMCVSSHLWSGRFKIPQTYIPFMDSMASQSRARLRMRYSNGVHSHVKRITFADTLRSRFLRRTGLGLPRA